MLTHATLNKEPSPKNSVRLPPARKPPPTISPEEKKEEVLDAPKFSWNFGEIRASAPGENGGAPPGEKPPWRAPAAQMRPLSWPIQAKLEIGAVDDPLEREADRIAEQVMRMPDPSALSSPTASDMRPGHQGGYPTLSESGPAIRRKCSCGGTCDTCKADKADEEQGKLQRKPALSRISRLGSSASRPGTTAPAIVHEVLRSPGQPLDAATRDFMEPRFGQDFSTVRVHTATIAAQSAEAVDARAFTAGRDLVFGCGQYAPSTREGQRLLAHELTHVVQQSGRVSRPFIQRDLIPYGQITWADFKATPPAIDSKNPQQTDREGAGIRSIFDLGPSYSAATDASPAKPSKPCGTGKSRSQEYEATAKPQPDSFNHPQAQMDRDQSWARKLYKTGDGTDYCKDKIPICEASLANSKAGIFFNGTKITKKEECTTRMVPNCLQNDAPTERSRLLNHEQYHFNITNVLANNARADLKARGATLNVMAPGCGNDAARDAATKDYESKVDDVLRKPMQAWFNAKNKAQDDYDTETVHGSDQGKQSTWETKIKDGLKGYGPPPVTPPAATPATSPAPPAVTNTPPVATPQQNPRAPRKE